MSRDLRVELVLNTNEVHTVSYAASGEATGGEAWRCRCGVSFKGGGALRNGRRHCAEQLLAALDDAAMVP